MKMINVNVFFINNTGAKKCLEKIIDEYNIETILQKEVLSKRNIDNIEMINLIKNIIAFNEDVLHFISDKIAEYFKTE